MKHFPVFIQDYTDNQESLKDIANAPVYQKVNELAASCVKDEDLLDLYLYLKDN